MPFDPNRKVQRSVSWKAFLGNGNDFNSGVPRSNVDLPHSPTNTSAIKTECTSHLPAIGKGRQRREYRDHCIQTNFQGTIQSSVNVDKRGALFFYMLVIENVVLAVAQSATVRAVAKLHLGVGYISNAANCAFVEGFP
jgi:hypothetical protein